jgi:hypothetical protein
MHIYIIIKMLSCSKKKINEFKPKKSGRSKKTEISSVIQEYCLKRSQINPKNPSPNRFCNKLEYRMKSYYNTLYTLSSSPPK